MNDAKTASIASMFRPLTATSSGSISEIGSAFISSGHLAVSGKTSTPSEKKIESAVYAHLRAMRTLGHTKADSGEIARALNIPSAEVIKALSALKNKGVKVVS